MAAFTAAAPCTHSRASNPHTLVASPRRLSSPTTRLALPRIIASQGAANNAALPRDAASALTAPTTRDSISNLRIAELAPAYQRDHLKLLTTWASPFGMRIMVALHEKGLQFEYVEEILGSFSPQVIVANPVHKKIPVLLHNGVAISESRIILEYIDEQWPASSSSSPRDNLMPASPWARAQARFWADFIDSKLAPESYGIVIDNGEKQQLAIKKTLQNLYHIDKGALKMQAEQSLDSTNKNGPFFNNEDTISFFDITFVGFLQWLRVYEFISPFRIPNANQCPRLHAWIDAISQEESVQKCIPNLESLIKRAQTTRCRMEFEDWNTLYK